MADSHGRNDPVTWCFQTQSDRRFEPVNKKCLTVTLQKCMKIPKGQSEVENRRTDNTMAKRKRTKHW
jgi:hypothetical protein